MKGSQKRGILIPFNLALPDNSPLLFCVLLLNRSPLSKLSFFYGAIKTGRP
jgi:hypothetical protein